MFTTTPRESESSVLAVRLFRFVLDRLYSIRKKIHYPILSLNLLNKNDHDIGQMIRRWSADGLTSLWLIGDTSNRGQGSAFAASDEVESGSLFTATQSADGKAVYQASCAACHGSSLEGLSGPSLTGPEFTARWSREDRSLESFYYILRMTMPRDDELWMNNRGVAIKDGRVFKGTADGYLIALDAADGRLLWARHVADPKLGETITMAPMVWKDLVLIGPAGS
jgi:cytochrome c553